MPPSTLLLDTLGLHLAPPGMGDGTDSGLYHPGASTFATSVMVDHMIGLHNLPWEDWVERNQDRRLTDLHATWKIPGTYYPPGHSRASVMPRFRLGEWVPMDQVWMMEYTALSKEEVPLHKQCNHMVHYLNNFWVLINNSLCTMGSKELNPHQLGTKRAMLLTRKLGDFQSVMKNFNLHFQLTDTEYTKEYVQSVRDLFGSTTSL